MITLRSYKFHGWILMKNELLIAMGCLIQTEEDLEAIPGNGIIDIDRLVKAAVNNFGWKDCSKVRKAAQAAIDKAIANSKWPLECWLERNLDLCREDEGDGELVR